MSCGGKSLFGDSSQFIKFQGGDLIAVEGANTVERMLLNELRLPYKQILKSRIILKEGQINYLLNHLGLGDSVNFLAIKVIYNSKSVNDEDNYVNWNFHNDFTKVYSMGKFMILTGNTTNRIPQIYLSNPNTKYSVTLEVLVAIIDDENSLYNDNNQIGKSFMNLTYTSIKTHIIGESIVVKDSNNANLGFFDLSSINSIEHVGKTIIVDDSSLGRVFFDFVTVYDSHQALSLLYFAMSGGDIDSLNPTNDSEAPIVFFNSGVLLNGVDNTNTSEGDEFDYEIVFNSVILKQDIIDMIVDKVVDNRDGIKQYNTDNFILKYNNIVYSAITSIGTYELSFNLSDYANNFIESNKIVKINVI